MQGNLQILELSTFGISALTSERIASEYEEPLQTLVRLTLDHKYVQGAFAEIKGFSKCSIKDLHSVVKEYLSSIHNEDNTERSVALYCFGVCCLQAFVQRNWTGPAESLSELDHLFLDDNVLSMSRTLLGREEHQVVKTVKATHYLYAAETIFQCLHEQSVGIETASWWLLRCYAVHSAVVNVHSESLFKQTSELVDEVFGISWLNDKEKRSFLLQLNLEVGLLLLHYYQYRKANDHFMKAKELAAIDFSFTGALGYRTKFQTKAIPQLQMNVQLTSNEKFPTSVCEKPDEYFPKNLALHDDMLLEKLKLVEEGVIVHPDLCAEQSAVILASCTAMQKASPSSKLQQEEIATVLEVLLASKSCWCVYSEALRCRCKNEKDRSRTVERSMNQLEDLVTHITHKEPITHNRLDLFYAVMPQPLWQVQSDLAKLYMSLGAVGSALQQYEALEMWEDAILCLIQSDRIDAANEMINKQLKINETPNLWCLLGDIMQEPKHYEKAWEISGHRSSRAMKSLGAYHASKKQYEKATECFEKSLSVLSLQVGTWFTLGCSYLVLQEYTKAAGAFRSCVSLDWDNYEAWTNLSASYVRSGKKKEAFKALSEAIKCNFDKWQLWENYVVIATDIGRFSEAMTGYERLLNIREKFVDIPVLKVLVRAVTENILDAADNKAGYLKPKLLKLFGHITSQTTSDPLLWMLYGQLCGGGTTESNDENNKAIDYLHKSLRMGMQKSGWEKDDATISDLVQTTELIAKACKHCEALLNKQTVASLRMTVRGLSTKLKQREMGILNREGQDTLKTSIATVEQCMDTVTAVLNAINAAQ